MKQEKNIEGKDGDRTMGYQVLRLIALLIIAFALRTCSEKHDAVDSPSSPYRISSQANKPPAN